MEIFTSLLLAAELLQVHVKWGRCPVFISDWLFLCCTSSYLQTTGAQQETELTLDYLQEGTAMKKLLPVLMGRTGDPEADTSGGCF